MGETQIKEGDLCVEEYENWKYIGIIESIEGDFVTFKFYVGNKTSLILEGATSRVGNVRHATPEEKSQLKDRIVFLVDEFLKEARCALNAYAYLKEHCK